MADIFSPEKRSWVMSRIRSKETKIEFRTRDMLDEVGYKFEMHPKVFGRPDFIIRRKKIAIFCDGDFWHGYQYHKKRKPAKKFWRDKIERNIKRDKNVNRKLREDGWKIVRLWEHDIESRPAFCIMKIKNAING